MPDVVDVVVARARKADQLPAGEAAIAFVQRIREISFLGVVPDHVEEQLARHALQLHAVVLKLAQQPVLVVRAEGRERPIAERTAAVRVDGRDRGAVQRRRRALALVALLLGAVGPGTGHVPVGGAAEGAGKLAVDEDGDAGLGRTRAEHVRRDQACHRGVDEGDLGRREKRIGCWDRRRRARNLPPRPRGCAWPAGEPGDRGGTGARDQQSPSTQQHGGRIHNYIKI